ncbi:MAG: hypothetical protein M3R38_09020 [Actinomycetota bacterium]|nr:hypothetical protein [Actinomycetota bacterium]
MSSATSFRLSGLSLLVGGLLAIIYLFIHPESNGLAYHADPMTALSHLMGFVSLLLILLGLPGLCARQAERAGILGLVSTLMVFFGVAILDGTHNVIDSTVTPALATIQDAGPLLAEGGPLDQAMQSGMQGTLVSVGGPTLLLGLILLGISTIRADVLPRWAGALPVVAALTVPLGFVVPSLEGVAFTMPYVALGCLGLVLVTDEGVSARHAVKPTLPRVQ